MIKKQIALILLIVLVAGYANFVTSSFSFEPFYSLYPDAVGLYSLHNLNDSSLLTRDLMSATTSDVFKSPSGFAVYLAVYRFLLRILPLPLALKVLAMIICALCTLLIYRAGIKMHSEKFAFLFSVLFLVYFSSMDTFYGGIGKGFGLLTFCLFFYFLVKERFCVLPFFIPLGVITYAYVSVIFAIVCFLVIFFFGRKQISFKKYIPLYILGIIAAFFMPGISRAVSGALSNLSLVGINKYTQNLVAPVETFNPLHIILYFIFNLNEHGKLYNIYFSRFFIFSCLLFMVIRPTKALRLPQHVWVMLLGATLGFVALYPFHPVSASRQFVFTMPFFLVIVFSFNLFDLIKDRIRPVVISILAILAFMALYPLYGDMISYRRYKPVYDYVRQLPGDVLVAGYPSSTCVDSIPFFAKRANFFADQNYTWMHYVFPGEEVRRRREDLIKALYAGSLDEVRIFISRYNIDYLVVEDRFNHRGFIDYLERSITLLDRDTYALVKDGYGFSLFNFAEKNYDFKIKIPEGRIFVVASKKFKDQALE